MTSDQVTLLVLEELRRLTAVSHDQIVLIVILLSLKALMLAVVFVMAYQVKKYLQMAEEHLDMAKGYVQTVTEKLEEGRRQLNRAVESTKSDIESSTKDIKTAFAADGTKPGDSGANKAVN